MDTSNRPDGEVSASQVSITRLSYILGREKQQYADLSAGEWLVVILHLLQEMDCRYLSNFNPLKADEFSEKWLSGSKYRVTPPEALVLCDAFQMDTRCQTVTHVMNPFGYEDFGNEFKIGRPESYLLLTQEGVLIQWAMSYYEATELPDLPVWPYHIQKHARTEKKVFKSEFTVVTEEALLYLLKRNSHFGQSVFSSLVNMIHQTIEDREKRLESLRGLKGRALKIAERMSLTVHFSDRFGR